MNITTPQELKDKIERNRYAMFTFPMLDVTVRHRKPDLLKLSLKQSLPSVMAEAVIEAYKSFTSGSQDDYKAKVDAKMKNFTADESLLEELSTKGYTLLSELCISHKILDVKESDPDNNLLAWSDIPEQDSIAFVMHLLMLAQESQTADGGETSAQEVETFPSSKRKSKRTVSSDSGEDVRDTSE